MNRLPIALTMALLLFPQGRGHVPKTDTVLDQAVPKPKQPSEISGHVYRADTGEPLAGATVTLDSEPPSPKFVSSVRTTSDGGYQFSGIAPGSYVLTAVRIGFTEAHYKPVWADGKPSISHLQRM